MKIALRNYFVKHKKGVNTVKNYLLIILAAFLFAAGVEIFLTPNRINAGGFVGISQIIDLWTPVYFSTGILFIIVNIPLVTVACFFFSKRFVIKTVTQVIFTGAFMFLIRFFNLAERSGISDGSNLTLLSIAGGALTAMAVAISFSVQGSGGGTDILGLILQKRYKMSNASRLMLLFDIVVIVIYALIIKNLNSFFYSFTSMAAFQITLELIFNSISNAVMFEIITDNGENLIKAINEELDRGSTTFKAVGTYTKAEKQVLICVVRKRQEAKARELIKKIDPKSFAYTLPIKEVIGQGFKNINF